MSFITRSQWGSKPPKSVSHIDIHLRRRFIVHYSTGEELGREDCADWVREIQSYHMRKGWSDIGYNELVCKHGDVFEGRGRDAVGAHCPGQNSAGIGVCYLGNDDLHSTDATPEARAAIRQRWEAHSHAAGRILEPAGHRDYKATTCPGQELYDWVKSGMVVGGVSPPAPTGGGEVRWEDFPVLRRGSTGHHVRILQALGIAHGWGFSAADVDGQFGGRTENALKAWQSRTGVLPPTGAVDANDWKWLVGA